MNDYNLVDLDLEFIRDNIDSVDVLSTDGDRDEKMSMEVICFVHYIYPSVCTSVCTSVCQSVSLKVSLSVYMSGKAVCTTVRFSIRPPFKYIAYELF